MGRRDSVCSLEKEWTCGFEGKVDCDVQRIGVSKNDHSYDLDRAPRCVWRVSW